MDEARLVSRLAELTGLLSPAEGTPPEALDQARRLLAEALLNGQSELMEDPSSPSSAPTTIDTLPQQTVDDLRRIVQDAIPAQRDRSLRIFRRTWPLLATHVPQSVPTWASGWSPESSIGPFESAEGGLVWFDIRRTATPVLLIDSQTERPLISLPQATLSAGPVDVGRYRSQHSRRQRLACGIALRLELPCRIVCRPSYPRRNPYAQPCCLRSRKHPSASAPVSWQPCSYSSTRLSGPAHTPRRRCPRR